MGSGLVSAPQRAARILHVITGLDVGGAETSLLKLLATLDRSGFEPAVVSLKGHGPIAKKITELDVPVYSARIREPGAKLAGLRELLRTIRLWSPDLIQGWMYHGNLAALALARLAPGRPPAIWNVRHSIDRLNDEKKSTRWVIRAGSLCSRRAVRIVYNSQVSAQQHECLGYSQRGTIVIPNGFDIDCFKPSAEHRRQMREHLGISTNAFVAGMIARYHPMKDHPNFIAAAKQVRAAHRLNISAGPSGCVRFSRRASLTVAKQLQEIATTSTIDASGASPAGFQARATRNPVPGSLAARWGRLGSVFLSGGSFDPFMALLQL